MVCLGLTEGGEGKLRLYMARICDRSQPEAQTSCHGLQCPPVWLLHLALFTHTLSSHHPIPPVKPDPLPLVLLCMECPLPIQLPDGTATVCVHVCPWRARSDSFSCLHKPPLTQGLPVSASGEQWEGLRMEGWFRMNTCFKC